MPTSVSAMSFTMMVSSETLTENFRDLTVDSTSSAVMGLGALTIVYRSISAVVPITAIHRLLILPVAGALSLAVITYSNSNILVVGEATP